MKSYNFDSLKFATEGLTGFGCTVIQDNANLPSFMIPINKRTNAQLFNGSQKTHNAFDVDNVLYRRFFVSKFLNCIVNGRAYSWPNMDPASKISYNDTHIACNTKGSGFHLMSIEERAVINHLISKGGFIPHGNTQNGISHYYPFETGVETDCVIDVGGSRTSKTATGSGPAAWFHDGTRNGIADWVGNVNKWISGLRIVDGEIQIFSGNMAANQVEHAATSTYWKAILPSGALVNPGTDGTLKFTSSLTVGIDRKSIGRPQKSFGSLTAESGVDIPEILKELCLFPISGTITEGSILVNTDSECMPFVGGAYNNNTDAGPSMIGLISRRTSISASPNVGFYSSFIESDYEI